MYLVGAEHPNKAIAAGVLARLALSGEKLVTDAEVLQEILHRYSAINRADAIQPAFDALLAAAEEVFPIDRAVVEAAKALLMAYPMLSARDSIHLATMHANSVSTVFSFDKGFDVVPNVLRISS